MSGMAEKLAWRYLRQADDLSYEKGMDPLEKAVKSDKAMMAKADNSLVKFTTAKIKPLLAEPGLPEDIKQRIFDAFSTPGFTRDKGDALSLYETDSWKSIACGRVTPQILWDVVSKEARKTLVLWKRYISGEFLEVKWWSIYHRAQSIVDDQRGRFLWELVKGGASQAYYARWTEACETFNRLISHEFRTISDQIDRTKYNSDKELNLSFKRLQEGALKWIEVAESIADEYCGLPRRLGALSREYQDLATLRYKVYEKLGKSSAFDALVMKTKSIMLEESFSDHVSPERKAHLEKMANKLEQLHHDWGVALNNAQSQRGDLWGKMFDFAATYEAILKEAGYKR